MNKAESSAINAAKTKENKFKQEEATLHADKAAAFPPNLNEIPKENNPV